jgi:hypothetical protein
VRVGALSTDRHCVMRVRPSALTYYCVQAYSAREAGCGPVMTNDVLDPRSGLCLQDLIYV